MITEVMDRNVVAIPERLASQHGIKPGSRLDWTESDRPDVLTVKVLPDYVALAASLLGAGRKHLKPGDDPVADLVQERAHEDADRRSSL
jgi:bifunctional DNA-binding transcriptional regulator/antitoxin component of YhaV-PrlF toxin-antitoxin module